MRRFSSDASSATIRGGFSSLGPYHSICFDEGLDASIEIKIDFGGRE
jgi:hypothetical protein